LFVCVSNGDTATREGRPHLLPRNAGSNSRSSMSSRRGRTTPTASSLLTRTSQYKANCVVETSVPPAAKIFKRQRGDSQTCQKCPPKQFHRCWYNRKAHVGQDSLVHANEKYHAHTQQSVASKFGAEWRPFVQSGLVTTTGLQVQYPRRCIRKFEKVRVSRGLWGYNPRN
jgi:hypothetical protein